MRSIYKKDSSKEDVIRLYDSQLKKLGYAYKDIYVTTSFGKTHLIESGNFNKKDLLVFHGGNTTSAYNLLACDFLMNYFHIYAVDTIGHPGKSEENSLSPLGYEYGEWASEVIDKIGIDKIRCFGTSFGGGVLAKLMCVSPEKIEKSVLEVPSAIHNGFILGTAKMMIPLIKYTCTKKEKYIKKTALCMSISDDMLDSEILDTIKNSFDNVKTKVGMPSNVSSKLIKNCTAPTLVIASELDCLFPAKKVLKRAQKIIPNCTTYELKKRGHMHLLTDEEKSMIINFLN